MFNFIDQNNDKRLNMLVVRPHLVQLNMKEIARSTLSNLKNKQNRKNITSGL